MVVRGPRAVNRIFDLMELERVLTLVDEPPDAHTVLSVTEKPREAALARMPWTVGPSSLHAPAHRRLTMPSALPVRDVDERSARVAPVDRAADVVDLGVVEAHDGLALLLRGGRRVVAEAVAGELDLSRRSACWRAS